MTLSVGRGGANDGNPRQSSTESSTALPESTPRRSVVDQTIRQAITWLQERQDADGYWVDILDSNSCMEAEWMLCMHVLGLRDHTKFMRVAKAILNQQRADGSWEVFHAAPAGDINTTVECYAALRCAGYSADDPQLKLAREWIFNNGGMHGIRNFTKYWLALIGEWPWDGTPQLPPEMIYFPTWFPFNVYHFASWGRGTLIPLLILSARRPVRPLPPESRLNELFPKGRDQFDFSLHRRRGWLTWEGFFHFWDRVIKSYNKAHGLYKPGREQAIKLCLEWIIRHQDGDGAWSGIQPPWIYSLMALSTEGYDTHHPVLKAGVEAFDKHWCYQRNGGLYFQASESPVWDTILALLGILDCDAHLAEENNPFVKPALDWLLSKQLRCWGDWMMTVKNVSAGGWAFQRANTKYPDVDDTAMAVVVLARLKDTSVDDGRINPALQAAREWMLGMQCRNGGWAAFDRNNDFKLLTKIPFCDFGELLDPPSVDVTAHVIEAFAACGMTLDHPAVRGGMEYIKREQEEDGSWFGRWGVNYIYGTAAVLPALQAIGEDMSQPYVRKALQWMVAHQNADGGWGENTASYVCDALRGRGHSTASQTAWALMTLVAGNSHDYDTVIARGLDFLVRTLKEGTWEEQYYTGTGFPGYGVGERVNLHHVDLHQGVEMKRAFMIRYNMYRHYFPLMALGRARKHLGSRLGK